MGWIGKGLMSPCGDGGGELSEAGWGRDDLGENARWVGAGLGSRGLIGQTRYGSRQKSTGIENQSGRPARIMRLSEKDEGRNGKTILLALS
jgi:hypothetical protein